MMEFVLNHLCSDCHVSTAKSCATLNSLRETAVDYMIPNTYFVEFYRMDSVCENKNFMQRRC